MRRIPALASALATLAVISVLAACSGSGSVNLPTTLPSVERSSQPSASEPAASEPAASESATSDPALPALPTRTVPTETQTVTETADADADEDRDADADGDEDGHGDHRTETETATVTETPSESPDADTDLDRGRSGAHVRRGDDVVAVAAAPAHPARRAHLVPDPASPGTG